MLAIIEATTVACKGPSSCGAPGVRRDALHLPQVGLLQHSKVKGCFQRPPIQKSTFDKKKNTYMI